jgi:hypothetical protein
MSRRRLNPDGTITVLSMSYFGQGDAEEALKREWEAVEQHNREALAVWHSLTPEEREKRMAAYMRDTH